MKTILPFCVFNFFTLSTLLFMGTHSNPLSSDHLAGVTFAELEALGLGCNPLNTCQGNETDYWLDQDDNCDCDSSCSTYDTCCIDSEFSGHEMYFKPENKLKCLPVYGHQDSEIFMVASCGNSETSTDLCLGDPEEDNDPFLMVPVTSKVTGITYKNFFCAVCNENVNSDQLQLWDIIIWSEGTQLKNLSQPRFSYDKAIKSWTVIEEESDINSSPIPAIIRIEQNAKVTVKSCSSDMIENCADGWTDISVEEKCKAYMAKITISRDETSVRYRNPHCALCNFEDLRNAQCYSIFPGFEIDAAAPDSISRFTPLVGMFVLDVNERRCGRDMIYDKFANKCRCNTRIYARKNGRCVLRV